MAHDAQCPECDWKPPASTNAPDRLVSALKDLEGHLAGDHDWTWHRAHEHAETWYRRLLKLPSPLAAGGRAPSRTASCDQCAWTIRAQSEDLLEVGRCSSEIEKHLREAHAASETDAQGAAEGWALSLLRNRVR